jgi:ABC-2 type transport system ATP-binding protein
VASGDAVPVGREEGSAISSPPDSVVSVRGLTKRYGEVAAVDGLDLTIAPGEIFGLLGPNGAGKTTTLRALLGLCRPTSGTVSVHGLPAGSAAALRQTGSLIENPAFYPYMDGRDNLLSLARMRRLPEDEVDQVLENTGMAGYPKVKFGHYSLGMKQRLGVAAALLGDPALMILDEPTNGLDPSGTADMRRLMVKQRDHGRTVILSSHLLGEVEQVCDRVCVMDKGRLKAIGSVAELGSYMSPATVIIAATPTDQAITVLHGNDMVAEVAVEGGRLRVKTRNEPTDVIVGQLNLALVHAGIVVHDLRLERPSLEQIYLKLASRNGNDAH